MQPSLELLERHAPLFKLLSSKPALRILGFVYLKGECSTSELIKASGLKKATFYAALSRLAKLGLVEKRSSYVKLSPFGRSLLEWAARGPSPKAEGERTVEKSTLSRLISLALTSVDLQFLHGLIDSRELRNLRSFLIELRSKLDA